MTKDEVTKLMKKTRNRWFNLTLCGNGIILETVAYNYFIDSGYLEFIVSDDDLFKVEYKLISTLTIELKSGIACVCINM